MVTVAKKRSTEEQAAAVFAGEVSALEMTVLLDQGLYRHLRFQRPGWGVHWFDLVTWPGALAVRGDVDGFMFACQKDMFAFFRGSAHQGRPNVGYWAEKSEGGTSACRAYDEGVFKQAVLQDVHERADERPAGLLLELHRELFDSWLGVSTAEETAHAALDQFEYEGFEFYDTWEWDFRDWDWHFRRACHRVLWGIGQYDAAKQQDGGDES